MIMHDFLPPCGFAELAKEGTVLLHFVYHVLCSIYCSLMMTVTFEFALNGLGSKSCSKVTFGAPNIVGRGSGKPETTRALHELHTATW